MDKWFIVLAGVFALTTVEASWYWPFGGDEEAKKPRVSELMEPATDLIDTAAEYAEDGNVDKAVETYAKALAELDRIEIENPDRAGKPEFATLRNKRAYVNSAIDSLLLAQARRNSASVAITDTTELEKEYEKIQEQKRAARSGRRQGALNDDTRFVDSGLKDIREGVGATNAAPQENAAPSASRRERLAMALGCLRDGDYDSASAVVRELLAEKPNDAAALNLKANIEAAKGELRAAEKTLDGCITSNPKSYYAFYNLARVILQSRGESGKASARRYYEAGRDLGGPADAALEEATR
ncbi:MAG: tetratricopeptide repeat protein [Kiritimatiellae bacterium]|nr:tetratricopeptide repeat protein [Kiritimatiellia bacterium]